MDSSYQCPVCGGEVTRADGCRRCGRPYDPEVAALAMFKRTVAALEAKKRGLTDQQLMLRTQLAHASAQRDSLAKKVQKKLEAEASGKLPLRQKRGRRHGPGALPPGTPAAPRRPNGPDAPNGPHGPGGPPEPGTPDAARTPGAPGAVPAQAAPGAVPAPAPTTPAATTAAPATTARPATAAAPPAETAAPPPGTAPPAGTAAPPPPRRPAGPYPPTPAPGRGAAAPRTTRVAPPERVSGVPTRIAARLPEMLAEPRGPRGPRRRRVFRMPARLRPPVRGRGRLAGAETTTGTAQNVLLGLGGLLLGGAAVVLAVLAFATVGSLGRAVLLLLATAVALALPVLLARRTLTATAETVAAVGLLLVLLDGYVSWSLDLFGAASMPTSVYFGFVCLVTAGVAVLYRSLSRLVAPRVAAVLVLQPVLPLFAYPWTTGAAGWSLIFVGLAALDLAFAVSLSFPGLLARFYLVRPPRDAGSSVSAQAEPVPAQAGAAEADADGGVEPVTAPPADVRGERFLRELTWVLFTLAFGTGFAYAVTAVGTTTTLPATVRAAVVLLLSAAVGLGGALAWRRRPLADVAGGLATVAVIVAITRVGAVATQDRAMLFGALGVVIAALGVSMLPTAARRGPQMATGLSAAATGVVLVLRALPAIGAPLRAALPVWHADLQAYPHRLAAAAGSSGWQLVAAALLLTIAAAVALPPPVRAHAVLTGVVVTLLTAPAALHLGWAVTPALLAVSAVGMGAAALGARAAVRVAYGCLGAGAVLGGYAAAAGLTRPAATSLTLLTLALGGALVAGLRPPRTEPAAEMVAQTVADVAAGGAAFALPGGVAAGMAALVAERVLPGAATTAVLAASFLAVCVTLGYAAVSQVARRGGSPPLLLGTVLGAGTVAIAALVARGTTTIDRGVGLLLLVSAVMLWLAPSLGNRQVFGQYLEGPDVAAAAVTASVVGALSRVVSLAVPDAALVVTAVLVLAIAVAVRSMPAAWQPGPVTGGALVALVVAAIAGGAAVAGGIGVVRAASPLWHASLGPAWLRTAQQYTAFGWQAPVALLLLAAAAAIAVPRPYGDDAAAAALGLAAVGAPAGLGLPWWSALLLGVVATMGIGVWAAATRSRRGAYSRLGVAGLLAAYTAAASLVRPAATGSALESLVLVGVVVAGLAGLRLASARTATDRAARAHLAIVGGSSVAVAILCLAGAAAAFAASLSYPLGTILTGTLAATSVGLTAAGLLCWRMPGFLPYVTAAVATAGTVVALVSLRTPAVSPIYAAVAALLGVLAELMRRTSWERTGWRPEDGMRPIGGWSPERLRRPLLRWRPTRPGGGFGAGIAAASGVPAALAVLLVAPAVVAALFGPYRWVTRPWTGTPSTAGDLGSLARYAGTPADVLAAAALTLAGALVAVGLAGRGATAASRGVAVAVPGAALTILIAPAALHAPGPMQATAALLVSTLCQLGLSLTPPAPDTPAAAPVRAARRVVFVLAVLAAGAGVAGSLATRAMTIETLAGSVVVGLTGAWWGRTRLARLMEWQVAAGAAVLLALAGGLAAGSPARWCAFPVLGVSAVLVALAALLPGVRPRPTVSQEAAVIESVGFAGAGLALALTYGAARYTAAVCIALGAVLGLAASRPGRADLYRRLLVIAGAASEVLGIWLLMRQGQVRLLEAYTLPFAAFALLVGVLELRRRPDLGSWRAYGPALAAGFAPTLVLVLSSDSTPLRRVLLIVAAVLTTAVGAVRRQKAPVVVGGGVTAVTTLHEIFLLGRFLPWWVLLALFTGAGVLLVGLGATYERRRQDVVRLRGALGRMR